VVQWFSVETEIVPLQATQRLHCVSDIIEQRLMKSGYSLRNSSHWISYVDDIGIIEQQLTNEIWASCFLEKDQPWLQNDILWEIHCKRVIPIAIRRRRWTTRFPIRTGWGRPGLDLSTLCRLRNQRTPKWTLFFEVISELPLLFSSAPLMDFLRALPRKWFSRVGGRTPPTLVPNFDDQRHLSAAHPVAAAESGYFPAFYLRTQWLGLLDCADITVTSSWRGRPVHVLVQIMPTATRWLIRRNIDERCPDTQCTADWFLFHSFLATFTIPRTTSVSKYCPFLRRLAVFGNVEPMASTYYL